MLAYNNLINELDTCAKKTFGEDYSEFSPTFITSIEKIEDILDDLYKKDIVTSKYFIDYWHNTIMQAYINGVYSSANRLLNKKKGKINSFIKGEETKRNKEIKSYEDNFSKRTKYILKINS